MASGTEVTICPTCGQLLNHMQRPTTTSPWPAVVTFGMALLFLFGLIALFRLT